MRKLSALLFIATVTLASLPAQAAWYDGGFGNGKFTGWLVTTIAEWWVGV